MTFASPLWLIALVPWTALAIWAMVGQPEKASVPFLNLWQAPSKPWPKPKRGWRVPPIASIALLAAILLAILAAARPMLMAPTRSMALTVVVDRGIYSPFAESAADLHSVLRRDLPGASVNLRVVPPSDSAIHGDWYGQVRSLAPTAADDNDALIVACRQSLRDTAGPVLLLSNRSLGISDGRLIQITSQSAITNVGIDRIAVDSTVAQSQVMVRLFNQSRLNSARLTILGGGKTIESRQVLLPAMGNKRDYFMDLPFAPGVVEADVNCDDSIKINHRAWAVRGTAWPIIEAASSLPPEMTRMIQVYSRRRPASEFSRRIAVTTEAQSLPAGMAAAIVPKAAAAGEKISAAESPVVRDSRLKIQSLDWPSILAGAMVLPPPAGNWSPIVSVGKSVAVAIDDSSARRVWVGFQSEDFAKKVDFVVFWSAVFNWLGGDEAEYVSKTVGALPIPIPAQTDWPAKLKSVAREAQARISMAEPALLAATALVALAALTWPGSKAVGRNILQS